MILRRIIFLGIGLLYFGEYYYVLMFTIDGLLVEFFVSHYF